MYKYCNLIKQKHRRFKCHSISNLKSTNSTNSVQYLRNALKFINMTPCFAMMSNSSPRFPRNMFYSILECLKRATLFKCSRIGMTLLHLRTSWYQLGMTLCCFRISQKNNFLKCISIGIPLLHLLTSIEGLMVSNST